jgi:hypothetical protein
MVPAWEARRGAGAGAGAGCQSSGQRRRGTAQTGPATARAALFRSALDPPRPAPRAASHQAYERTINVCHAAEQRLALFLELEMRFARLDMMWQTLSELIQ